MQFSEPVTMLGYMAKWNKVAQGTEAANQKTLNKEIVDYLYGPSVRTRLKKRVHKCGRRKKWRGQRDKNVRRTGPTTAGIEGVGRWS